MTEYNKLGMSKELEEKLLKLEPRFLKKLDVMNERCRNPLVRQDAFLVNDALTGEGKTNGSICEAGYVRLKLKRTIHMFFRLEKLIEYLKVSKNKLVIWDEPSLDALSTDQLRELNKNFKRLLNTMRKKRHFVIVNMTRFHKFSEEITTDRANGMVHLYSKKGIHPGFFVYLRQRVLEKLWITYKTKRIRLYKKLASFHGRFPEVMDKYFNEFKITIHGEYRTVQNATQQDYEDLKDEAIALIGAPKLSKDKLEIQKLRKLIGTLFWGTNLRANIARHFKISHRTLQLWAKIELEEPISQENEPSQIEKGTIMNNKGLLGGSAFKKNLRDEMIVLKNPSKSPQKPLFEPL